MTANERADVRIGDVIDWIDGRTMYVGQVIGFHPGNDLTVAYVIARLASGRTRPVLPGRFTIDPTAKGPEDRLALLAAWLDAEDDDG